MKNHLLFVLNEVATFKTVTSSSRHHPLNKEDITQHYSQLERHFQRVLWTISAKSTLFLHLLPLFSILINTLKCSVFVNASRYFDFIDDFWIASWTWKWYIYFYVVSKSYETQARRQDFAARGGQKAQGGLHYLIQYWMYAATGGPSMKWGTQIWNGDAGHHSLPAIDGPDETAQRLEKLFISFWQSTISKFQCYSMQLHLVLWLKHNSKCLVEVFWSITNKLWNMILE